MRLSILALLSFLVGCSPSSLTDFQHEGESRCRALAEDLQQIQSREQLVKAESLLKRHFEALTDLMIKAREFQLKHPDDTFGEGQERFADLMLEDELRRVYQLEGGREIIEKVQHEALVRLDAFERSALKRRERAR